ncbi:MAG: phage tail protein [Alphaproteobacteria bacterium]
MISFGDITKAAGGKINLNSIIPVEMMMILGVYRFCLKNAAYQTMQRSTEYNWQEQQRIGIEPALQFIGQGVDTIELPADCQPDHQRNPQSQHQTAYPRRLEGNPG